MEEVRDFWGRDIKELMEIIEYTCGFSYSKILEIVIKKKDDGYSAKVTINRG